jgi:hypothetical protein
MIKRLPFAALAATFVLSACNQTGEVANGASNSADANLVANAAPIELPAAIVQTRSYRCADKSVVQLDWREKNEQADSVNLRLDGATIPTVLTLVEGEANSYVAEGGFAITGAKADSSVQVTLPGKSAQACKA